jgi:hypothetical protein
VLWRQRVAGSVAQGAMEPRVGRVSLEVNQDILSNLYHKEKA